MSPQANSWLELAPAKDEINSVEEANRRLLLDLFALVRNVAAVDRLL